MLIKATWLIFFYSTSSTRGNIMKNIANPLYKLQLFQDPRGWPSWKTFFPGQCLSKALFLDSLQSLNRSLMVFPLIKWNRYAVNIMDLLRLIYLNQRLINVNRCWSMRIDIDQNSAICKVRTRSLDRSMVLSNIDERLSSVDEPKMLTVYISVYWSRM